MKYDLNRLNFLKDAYHDALTKVTDCSRKMDEAERAWNKANDDASFARKELVAWIDENISAMKEAGD